MHARPSQFADHAGRMLRIGMIDADDVEHQSRVDHCPVGERSGEQVDRAGIAPTLDGAAQDDDGEKVADIAADQQCRQTVPANILLDGD